jgi:GH24 family phage-related lysozyme (muramidase)
MINLELERQLIKDEGMRLRVYKDHLGYDTVGVGHRVMTRDNLSVGDSITRKQAITFFRKDVKVAVKDAKKFVGEANFERLPKRTQDVVSNMSFNLGLTKLNGFKNLKKALKELNFKKAAEEMKNSTWYRQVPNRAQRLIDEVLSEHDGEDKIWIEGFKRKDGVEIKGFWRNLFR